VRTTHPQLVAYYEDAGFTTASGPWLRIGAAAQIGKTGIVNLSNFGPPMYPWNLSWASSRSPERRSGGCHGRARDLVPGGESGVHLAPVFLGGEVGSVVISR
jgi:hypothetical protein